MYLHNIDMRRDLPKLRAAYDNHALAAQNGGHDCLYRSSRGPCAIGAMLPDDVAHHLMVEGQNGCSLKVLHARGDLSVHHNQDATAIFELRELQAIHDSWVGYHKNNRLTPRQLEMIKTKKAEFEALLATLEKKYCGENGQAQ